MQRRIVLGLVTELYLGARLPSFVRAAGHEYRRAETRAELREALRSARPALVVVDLAQDAGDLSEIARHAGEARLVAYGPLHDVEGQRAARAAGFHEVLPSIYFHRHVAELLARHLPVAPPSEAAAEVKGWRRLFSRGDR